MNRLLNNLHLMMKDSLIIIRARDRHFIRLIITQDRSIRFILVRLTITRAHARLTTLGMVTVEDMAEDMVGDTAEDTDTKRRLPNGGSPAPHFFILKMTIS